MPLFDDIVPLVYNQNRSKPLLVEWLLHKNKKLYLNKSVGF